MAQLERTNRCESLTRPGIAEQRTDRSITNQRKRSIGKKRAIKDEKGPDQKKKKNARILRYNREEFFFALFAKAVNVK